MESQSNAIRILGFCSRHLFLRPISRLLRLLQPLIIAHERTCQIVKRISQDPGLPSTNPTAAVWQNPPHPDLEHKQSSKLPEKADVVIIGSGITSASIAHHLLTADPTITLAVLEARTITSGATGRNGGHILELPYEDYATQIALIGREATKKLVQFRLDHLGRLVDFAKTQMSEKAARECEIRVVEAVGAVFDEEQWVDTKEQFRLFLEDFPEQRRNWTLWEGQEARDKFRMPNIFGAITGPAGALWPYRFVTGIFSELISRYPDRLQIETNTPVYNIEVTQHQSEHAYLVTTSRGTIKCKNVVHATNGHVGHLLPRLRGKIFPIRGQMTVQSLTSSGENPQNEGNKRSWFLKHGKGFDYMTQNATTGDYFLGGATFQGGNGGLDDIGNAADDERNFLAECHLNGVASRLFGADAGESALKASWTGVMGFSCDGRPWVGRLPASITGRRPRFTSSVSGGEWIAAGFCGNGMVYCWRSGEALAAMIRGQDVEWFPNCLLATEKRFRSVAAEDMAALWLSMAL